MKKPNNIETELNAIRADFYEQTKDMSPSEITAYLKAQVAPVHQKYGIHTVSEIKIVEGMR
jgi:hypothetical protein